MNEMSLAPVATANYNGISGTHGSIFIGMGYVGGFDAEDTKGVQINQDIFKLHICRMTSDKKIKCFRKYTLVRKILVLSAAVLAAPGMNGSVY